jgi:hypothetical protein
LQTIYTGPEEEEECSEKSLKTNRRNDGDHAQAAAFKSIFIIASAEEEFSIRQEPTAGMRQFGRRICDNDEEVKRIKEDAHQIVARNPETFNEEHNESFSPPLSRLEKPLLEPGSSATHLW